MPNSSAHRADPAARLTTVGFSTSIAAGSLRRGNRSPLRIGRFVTNVDLRLRQPGLGLALLTMTNDIDSPVKRGISEAAFFGLLALMVLAIIGVGIYFIGPLGSTNDVPHSLIPGPTQLLVPASPASPRYGPSEAGAVALVEKYFRLESAGQHGMACALESPAYLRSDAKHYSHGSCAAESRAVSAALASKGLAVRLIGTSVVSFSGDKATILTTVGVGTQVATEHIYMGYRAGRWWMTGGDDSGGDVGF